MTLAELTEPLLQYVCRVNRSARKGGVMEMSLVRAELRSTLDQMRARAGSTPGLSDSFLKIEKPIVFFADSMIYSSKLPWARQWRPLADELWGELGGDEKFFNLLDETLADPSPAAADRLEVFFTCLGLGFTGFYTGQPEFLRRKMLEIEARLRDRMDLDPAARIIPDDQLHPFLANLSQPPSGRLTLMGLVLVGLIIALVLSSVLLYNHAKSGLQSDLQTITTAAKKNIEKAPTLATRENNPPDLAMKAK